MNPIEVIFNTKGRFRSFDFWDVIMIYGTAKIITSFIFGSSWIFLVIAIVFWLLHECHVKKQIESGQRDT